MYKAPMVVGVRQLPRWSETTTLEDALLYLGQNTGNMMFTEALLRVIQGAEWGSFALEPSQLEGHDAIVLAAANWINSYDDFGWLADRLEKTKLPVILIGVGAQASTGMEIPVVKPGTLRLLKIVEERSVSIAARGEFSCEVLDKYRFKNTVATGCPSLMLAGPAGPKMRIPEQISLQGACIHSTRHFFQAADGFQDYLYRQAFKHDIDIILQSELADMYYVLDKPRDAAVEQRAAETVMRAYGSDDPVAVQAYLRRRGHVFMNYEDWVAFMKTKAFCFGTRIHGTVASIVAGTPATLIVHDSRTLEMAKAMAIPYVMSSDISTATDQAPQDLLLPEAIQRLIASFPKYYAKYLAFLAGNMLSASPSFTPHNDLLPVQAQH